MSYLVLARKWRPRSFDTIIGQDHVVKALTHALDTGRLHHAWLFTGTRGVGKTTLSRILAKSLNCESGVTSKPCGTCQACVEIDEGRFVDYVELDAASNRGVDEMTQLLEQAVYAPSAGRYKVYMIDEVHMLTGHAFNAMLKTLEEPPPHVKFILATTDPQKIPVTVLSRCLQFNLKQMTVPAIVDHLTQILAQESVQAEPQALRLIAQSAAGSMRDALSLTDQAIAYSAGNLSTADIAQMLGTMDEHHLLHMVQALANGDAAGFKDVADDLLARGLSFQSALADLAIFLSKVAMVQKLGFVSDDEPLADDIQQLAQVLSADDLQLFYAVAVHSRKELSLAPDEYAGFLMAGLRMLALLPDDRAASAEKKTVIKIAAKAEVKPGSKPEIQPQQLPSEQVASAAQSQDQAPVEPVVPAVQEPQQPEQAAAAVEQVTSDILKPEQTKQPEQLQQPEQPTTPVEQVNSAVEGVEVGQQIAEPAGDVAAAQHTDTSEAENIAPVIEYSDPSISDLDSEYDFQSEKISLADLDQHSWVDLIRILPLTGTARSLALNCELQKTEENKIYAHVAIHTLAESNSQDRLQSALSMYFDRKIILRVEYGNTGDKTVQAHDTARQIELQKAAEHAAKSDEIVLDIIEKFDAEIIESSIKPIVN